MCGWHLGLMTLAEAQTTLSTSSEAIQLLSLRISIIQLSTRGTDDFRTYWKHYNLDILIDIQYVCHLKIQISDLCCLIITKYISL